MTKLGLVWFKKSITSQHFFRRWPGHSRSQFIGCNNIDLVSKFARTSHAKKVWLTLFIQKYTYAYSNNSQFWYRSFRTFAVEDSVHPIQSMPLLLMTWRRKEPGHQWQWYWSNSPENIPRKRQSINSHIIYLFLSKYSGCSTQRVKSQLPEKRQLEWNKYH